LSNAKAPASEGGRYTKSNWRRKTASTVRESDGGLWAEDTGEARASELDADDAFAIGQGLGDVDDAALRFEFGVDASSGMSLRRNANLKIGADRDIEAGAKGGAASAQILAGSVFFKGKPARVATADA
jgi:hypothetical protein